MMTRRSFLQGVAAAVGVAALPEVLQSVVVPWSPDVLIALHAMGVAQTSGVASVWLLRPNEQYVHGVFPIYQFSLNTQVGALRFLPPPGDEPVGSDLRIKSEPGLLAAAVFRRPDGSVYVKASHDGS